MSIAPKILYIIDIDGCICDARQRYELAGPEPTCLKISPEWQTWVKLVMNQELMIQDIPVPGMLETCLILASAQPLLYVTSRSEIHYSITREWLLKHKFPLMSNGLIMRPETNFESDAIFKEAIIESYQTKYKINSIVVLDDDLTGKLAQLCKKHNWTFMKLLGFSL